ncbi:expressed unknown protein [Seminavis robusta]|uniref:RING-type domain-containing protein n=1 Tax=Seminavis robusta TaxID=568900 RepID=A0A9N8HSG0_9STRA|nr:expressed unknown protein [Seminavis robusta]|eukprot:Sro1381_g267860.1 n/a (245) ;mRNA; f:21771-22679
MDPKLEQQKKFGKICGSAAVGLLVTVFILSYLQEWMRRKCRARRHSKMKGLCTTTGAPTSDDVNADEEAMEENIRNSLVIKKYMILDDGVISATLGSMTSMSCSLPPGATRVPIDVETGNKDDISVSESISEDSDNNVGNKNSDKRSRSHPKKLDRMFSSLSTFTGSSETIKSKKNLGNRTHHSVCELCEKNFVNGDDVCESSSPRCNHVFHHECIASWISFQNACPCCSEPFVVMNMSQEFTS